MIKRVCFFVVRPNIKNNEEVVGSEEDDEIDSNSKEYLTEEKFLQNRNKPKKTLKLITVVKNPELQNTNAFLKLDKLLDILKQWFSDETFCFFNTQLERKTPEEEERGFRSKAYQFYSANPQWITEEAAGTKDKVDKTLFLIAY